MWFLRHGPERYINANLEFCSEVLIIVSSEEKMIFAATGFSFKSGKSTSGLMCGELAGNKGKEEEEGGWELPS